MGEIITLAQPADILGRTAAGDPFNVNLDAMIGSHVGIVAMSGGGKSGLVRRLLEATHGRIQHIVLDGEDEFYTLRERYDYVIAGGDGGDLPATVANAESLATAALTHGFSLIAQINDLGFEGAPEFVGRFLTALVNAPRRLWHPVLVVVDEAQRFVPRGGATAATAGVRALLSQGRKRGFTAVLAGTKFSEIDPPVRSGVHNWMLGMAGQAIDRNTMGAQLGFGAKEIRDRLANLEIRQFWAQGPALSREPTLFRVADVETTPIHAGQAKVPTPPPPEALRAILAGLTAEPVSDSQKQSGETTDVITHSRDDAEVERLQAQLSDIREQLLGVEHERDTETLRANAAEGRVTAALVALGSEATPVAAERQSRPTPAPAPAQRPVERAPAAASARPRGRVASPANDSLTGPQRRLLGAIAWWNMMGIGQPTRAQVAAIAGWRITSGHLKNVAGSANTAGLIHYPVPGSFALTEQGRAVAPEPDRSLTFLDQLRSTLTGPQATVFDTLLSNGTAMTRDDLANACGWAPTSGHVKNVLGSMRSLEVVDYPTQGMVALSSWVTA